MTNPLSVPEQVIIQGDLAKLAPHERIEYYNRVCESLNLNPLTKPFEYITLNGKLTLYAKKDCTEQLRKRDNVSITIVSRELVDGVYVVTAQAITGNRTDESIGAVTIENLKGDAKANAIMKAETKAKRRVTLSICGLGMLDETEVSDMPDARSVTIDEPSQAALPAPKPQRGATCSGCGAPIHWTHTDTGARTPMNVDANGNPTSQYHWETCPDAKKFRKQPRRRADDDLDAPLFDEQPTPIIDDDDSLNRRKRSKMLARIRELLRLVGSSDELATNYDDWSDADIITFGQQLAERAKSAAVPVA